MSFDLSAEFDELQETMQNTAICFVRFFQVPCDLNRLARLRKLCLDSAEYVDAIMEALEED
jgi:hypothetical protein